MAYAENPYHDSENDFYNCVDYYLVKNIEDFVYNEQSYRDYCAYR